MSPMIFVGGTPYLSTMTMKTPPVSFAALN
jgi:hypothetical protein